jgi:SAM-dependent methyltransferase
VTVTDAHDPFAQFKAMQREGWNLFLPLEQFTMIPAGKLVAFAKVVPGQAVLDVACGTGVVAITAARAGARVHALDLSPALLDRARENARVTGVEVDFVAGDAEALPYPDAAFDVVLSQFGHMFAPRPEVAVAEMMRVLKPGGRVAFATWPPDHFTGRMFALLGQYVPPPPAGAPSPAPPPQWGDPNVVRERLGARVNDLVFERDTLVAPTLGPSYSRQFMEATLGPLAKLVSALQGDPLRLAQLRAELERLFTEIIHGNEQRQHFLMSRATKV